MSEQKTYPDLIESSNKEVIEPEKMNENKIESQKLQSESKLYVSEPSYTYIPDNINEQPNKRIKIEIPKCPGCYPVFQPNQLGHIGPDGCLGDEY